MGWTTERSEFKFWKDQELLHVQTSPGAHPASYPMGTGALSLEVKQLGHEANHSHPTSAKANKI
jgi:hypothetical protein